MDPKQMAEIVGTTVRGMVDEAAAAQAKINAEVQDAINAIVGYLGEINEAVGVLNEKIDNPTGVIMTEDQIEEQRAAYRAQVIMEAARLGVTGGELARAKKGLVPDGSAYPNPEPCPECGPETDTQGLPKHRQTTRVDGVQVCDWDGEDFPCRTLTEGGAA